MLPRPPCHPLGCGRPATPPARPFVSLPRPHAPPPRPALVPAAAAAASPDAPSPRAAHNARQAAVFDSAAVATFLEPQPAEVEEVRK
jgi:hypothetical protein